MDNKNKKKNQSKTLKKLSQQATIRTERNEASVDALVEDLRAFVERNVRKILSGLKAGEITAKEAAKQLGGLEIAIEDAGLKDKLSSIKGLFSREFDTVTKEFTEVIEKAAPLSSFVRQNLSALADDRILLASKMVERHLGDIRSIVMDTVIAGETFNVEKVLDTAGDRVYANIKTEINTSLMAYNRVTHLEKAKKAGVTKFLYVGPMDEITRPFCEDKVGQVFTLDQIEEWDNEQGLPASIYCGGYNCRHHLRPISDELAEELDANRD